MVLRIMYHSTQSVSTFFSNGPGDISLDATRNAIPTKIQFFAKKE